VAPLAADDAGRYLDLSIALTFLTGLLCIAGGIAGFGVIADFLSRPILTGYLNGIALSIITGQLGTLLGFKVAPTGFFRTIAEVGSRLSETQIITFVVGLLLFVLLRVLRHLYPRMPAPLIAAAIGIGVVYALGLNRQGVAVVGMIPASFPSPRIPSVGVSELWPLIVGACGIVLVSFCSMMTTARGFASKNGYPIDVNQDMIALGVSVNVRFAGRELRLPHVIYGSGARYSDGKTTFWNKGDSVLMEVGDRVVVQDCMLQGEP
jgi:MFS superfamily sulfate permease-like transporter